MAAVHWLNGVPPAVSLKPASPADVELSVEERRACGERVKACLCRSPGIEVLLNALEEMARRLGVRPLTYEYHENPCWRLDWIVRVPGPRGTPWRYFEVRRLFGDRYLDIFESECLGPAWEAPADLCRLSDAELERLLSQETVEVRSRAGVRRIRVGDPGWEQQLQEALREAYLHPFTLGEEGAASASS